MNAKSNNATSSVIIRPAETLGLCPLCGRIVFVDPLVGHCCEVYEDCFPNLEPFLAIDEEAKGDP